MTNRARILALIRQQPGLTDRQIREVTDIQPHQQVNAICRQLQRQGLVRRERGPRGITTHPVAQTAIARPDPGDLAMVNQRSPSTLVDRWELGPLDWRQTLLVLP